MFAYYIHGSNLHSSHGAGAACVVLETSEAFMGVAG